jgi:hypothetical protein
MVADGIEDRHLKLCDHGGVDIVQRIRTAVGSAEGIHDQVAAGDNEIGIQFIDPCDGFAEAGNGVLLTLHVDVGEKSEAELIGGFFCRRLVGGAGRKDYQ